jgi:hypothetical protein
MQNHQLYRSTTNPVDNLGESDEFPYGVTVLLNGVMACSSKTAFNRWRRLNPVSINTRLVVGVPYFFTIFFFHHSFDVL